MIQMRCVWADGPFSGIHGQKTELDDTDERCKGRWAFFRGTLSENQNWMIQMRGARADGPFFRDTLSENKN